MINLRSRQAGGDDAAELLTALRRLASGQQSLAGTITLCVTMALSAASKRCWEAMCSALRWTAWMLRPVISAMSQRALIRSWPRRVIAALTHSSSGSDQPTCMGFPNLSSKGSSLAKRLIVPNWDKYYGVVRGGLFHRSRDGVLRKHKPEGRFLALGHLALVLAGPEVAV